MKKKYDYIVVGAGSAGVRFARLMATKGYKVCILEKSRVGGTCVIRGCVPKKLYVYASNFKDYFSDATSFGWRISKEPTHNWSKLFSSKNKEIARLNKIYIKNLERVGVLSFNKSDRNKLFSVLKKSKKIISAKKFIISTGSTPSMPSIPGRELAINSDPIF